MYCQSGTTSSLTRAMLLCALFICAEPGATCKLCLETGKSFRRSELNILVSLSFVFLFFWKQQLLLSPMQRLPLGFPVKIALSARGTMGRRFLSFPSHRFPRAFFSPSPQSPCVKKRPLRRREVVAHSDFLSEKNENLRVQSTLS